MAGALLTETPGSAAAALTTFMESISGALSDFSTTTLASVLVKGLGLAAGLVIAWFAFRFIKGKVLGALKKGKM